MPRPAQVRKWGRRGHARPWLRQRADNRSSSLLQASTHCQVLLTSPLRRYVCLIQPQHSRSGRDTPSYEKGGTRMDRRQKRDPTSLPRLGCNRVGRSLMEDEIAFPRRGRSRFVRRIEPRHLAPPFGTRSTPTRGRALSDDEGAFSPIARSRHYMSCHEPSGSHLLARKSLEETAASNSLPSHNHGNQHPLHPIALPAEMSRASITRRQAGRQAGRQTDIQLVTFSTNRIILGRKKE